MPSYRAAANTVPETDETHQATIFRFYPGWSLSERVRDTSAWVWQFGFDIQRAKERRWVCKHCIILGTSSPADFAPAGLQNAAGHLYRRHYINAPPGMAMSREEKRATARTSKPHNTIANYLDLSAEKPAEQAVINKIIQQFDRQRFQQLLVEWIVNESLPFSTAEHPGLRAIFEYLNPQVLVQQANLSRVSIKSRIKEQYCKHRLRVITALKAAPGPVHLVFDGWRSGNRKNVIGLTCVFPSIFDHQPRKITLGMPEMPGRHLGEEIARVVGDVTTEFEIDGKIGVCVTDNAGNNDTAMDHLGNTLGWDSWTGRKRRGRCFGHILNLAAKLLLYGNAEQRVDTFIERQEQLTDAEYNLWRKEGPVGKLRILVIAIDTSDRLTAAFQQIQQADINNAETERARSKKPLHVVKDNQTRWLGSLYMIRRALRVRIYFEQLKVKYKLQWEQENRGRDGHLRPSAAANIPVFLNDDNWLSGNDWVALEHLETILTSFESVLKKLEGDGQIRHRATGLRGSYGNVWDVLPSYEFQFKVGINAAWDKLNEYYNRLDDVYFYYASLAFHPAYGWAKISHFWDRHPDWLAKAKAIVKSHWEREHKTRPIPPDLIPSAPTPTGFAPSQAACRINEVDAFLQQGQLQGDRALEINDDEMEAWIAERPDPFDQYVTDPIAYWRARRTKYPRLSQMALDTLTIPAMSAECERLFSAAGMLLNPLRSSLDIAIVGQCMALRSWLRAGILLDGEVDPVAVSAAERLESEALQRMDYDQQVAHVTKWVAEGEPRPGIYLGCE
ncbi:hypothetical protein PG989_000127 [Apiospora arundinis]|uniref:AC transposase n=1 Tax=Apiospora arundinis TaxID=335852 RepID=A0ABR2IWQ3_9PEZI